MPTLPPADKKIVQKALATLPPRVDQAKQKEMGEMMGKLKEVCGGSPCALAKSDCSLFVLTDR